MQMTLHSTSVHSSASPDLSDDDSTARLSDQNFVLSKCASNFDISLSSESSGEESVVDVESNDDLQYGEFNNGFSNLPLFEGSSKTVLKVLAGYFYWFSNHPSISKSALSSLLCHEHFNVLSPGNNLPSSYEQAYNFIKPQLLTTVCYDACPNGCVLFRESY